jgi:hypothetical protein
MAHDRAAGIRSSPGWSAAAIATLINRRARHRLRQDDYQSGAAFGARRKISGDLGP